MRRAAVPRSVLRIEVRTPVRPTEEPERVRKAILNLFPDARIEESPHEMVGVTASLERLRELVRSLQIPDAARGAMLQDVDPDGRTARFLLGKQAAAAGKPHFGAARGPLGDLEVTVSGDAEHEAERAIYRVAPDTTVPPEWAEVPRSLRPPE
jgi:predicted RNA binding protein with dsRBD fold (UPF0201 family)